MKKFIMFLLALTVSGVVSAQTPPPNTSAPYLVYDYKASYDAITVSYEKVSYSLDVYDGKADYTGLFDTMDCKSDSLKGFLVIPFCEEGEEFGRDIEDNEAWIYVQRKGDKLTETAWKVPAGYGGAAFSKGVASRLFEIGDDLAGSPSSLKKLKKAWMWVDFDINDFISYVPVNYKGYESSQEVPYGFLGYQSTYGYVEQVGCGKLDVVTNSSSSTLGFCGNQIEPGESTAAVSSLQGCLIGWFDYTQLCDQVPMFDICDMFEDVNYAPICGKWSIKLNKKMSSGSLEAIEEEIKNKLKVEGFFTPETESNGS